MLIGGDGERCPGERGDGGVAGPEVIAGGFARQATNLVCKCKRGGEGPATDVDQAVIFSPPTSANPAIPLPLGQQHHLIA